MDFWDSLGDLLHTSDNERKRNEFKKLVDYLNKKIPKAEGFYNDLKTGCDMEFKIMKGRSSDAYGVLASMYDSKFNTYTTDTTHLLDYYKNILSAFRSKLSAAQSKYEYYVEECRKEDEERRRRQEEREREEREKAEQKAKVSVK